MAKLVSHFILIILYLEGKLDLYNGQYSDTIGVWDAYWDEMTYLGYKPDTARGVKSYMNEQL